MISIPSQPLVDVYDPAAVNRALADEIRTTHAVFFHQRNDALVMTTAHNVMSDSNGAPMVGPGRPMTAEDEQTLLDLLMGRQAQAAIDILPPTVLYSDRETLMWWLPPLVRPMHLRSHKLGDRTITVRWPNLVALVRGRTLYLAAVEGDARPTADSALFHAPLPNVYANGGEVCTGNARLPLSANVATMADWEAVVFLTYWTHTNHAATLRPPSEPRKTKRRVAAAKVVEADADYWANRGDCLDTFPAASLNPLGVSLAQWLPALTPANDRRPARRGRH